MMLVVGLSYYENSKYFLVIEHVFQPGVRMNLHIGVNLWPQN